MKQLLKNKYFDVTLGDVDKGFSRFKDGMRDIHKKRVLVGWFENVNLAGTESSVLRMAVLNEYGSDEGGGLGSAPLRTTFDDNMPFFEKVLGKELVHRLIKNERVDVILDDLGQKTLQSLKDRMREIKMPSGIIEGGPKSAAQVEKVSRELSRLADQAKARVEKA